MVLPRTANASRGSQMLLIDSFALLREPRERREYWAILRTKSMPMGSSHSGGILTTATEVIRRQAWEGWERADQHLTRDCGRETNRIHESVAEGLPGS